MNQSPAFTTFKKAVIVFGLVAAFIYISRPGGNYVAALQHIIYLFTYPIALFAVWSTVRVLGPSNPQQRALLTIFSGFTLAGIGQLLSDISQLIYKSEIVGLAATGFFFAAYAAVFVGYVMVSRAIKSTRKSSVGVFVFCVVLALSLGLLIYKYELAPLLGPGTLGLTEYINLGYVLADISLVIVSILIIRIVIMYRGGLLSQPWLVIFVGHFIILTADILLAIYSMPFYDDLWPYTLISLMWLVANLLIATGFYGIGGAILRAQARLAEQRPTP